MTRGQSPRAQLVLDNVGRGISEDLEALGPNELMMARLMVSDRADPNLYERDYYLPITSVSVAGATATAQCGVDYLMRQQACACAPTRSRYRGSSDAAGRREALGVPYCETRAIAPIRGAGPTAAVRARRSAPQRPPERRGGPSSHRRAVEAVWDRGGRANGR